MTQLETQGLTATRQMEIFNVAKYQLEGYAYDRLIDLESKTRDLHQLFNDNNYDYKRAIKFVPLVTVHVERSESYISIS
jgi:hypothetical protein